MTSLNGMWPERPSEFKRRKFGVCPTCNESQKQKNLKSIEDRNYYFNLGWKNDEIRKCFIDNPAYENQKLIIADTRGLIDSVKFTLVTVIESDVGRSLSIRILGAYDHNGGNLFYRTGKSVNAKTGQVYLLPYNEKIDKAISENDEFRCFGMTVQNIRNILEN